ncbi:MAG TPA: DinB family protein [Gemmatimonadaceae bacterium]|nr:DinB family protein [Gemmatimonadaceae bacterium]
MHRLSLAVALVAVASLPLASRPRIASGSVSDTRAIWSEVSKYITQSASDMSDADFQFRPTPEVRTFGQIIAHIAGTQHFMCASALGEPTGSEDDIEKTKTTKADIVAALKASNEYCAKAYAQSDDQVSGTVKLYGMDRSRFYALVLNATHDNEHYGNIVTYMRMRGLVPPSSRPSTTQ